ncbi:hypothetical protein Bca4012_052914 [Brassica carinata]
MDDFPLPPGLDVDQFVKNVELAISNAGALGEVEFFAYGSSDSFDYGRYLESMSFTPAKVVGKRSRFYRLVHRMLNWVHKRQQYGGKKNLLVIAKAMPGEDNINLISFLDEMIDRYHNVFTLYVMEESPENVLQLALGMPENIALGMPENVLQLIDSMAGPFLPLNISLLLPDERIRSQCLGVVEYKLKQQGLPELSS